MKTRSREIVNALWLAAALGVLFFAVTTCHADCVVAFEANWCQPCQRMHGVVEKLRGEGFDIRPVNIDARPDLKIGYRIRRIPAFLLVAETPAGGVEVSRLEGEVAEDKLREFARQRIVRNVAPVANAVRSLFGMPLLLGE